MQTVYLFDLDNTLVSAKCRVPRPTWWLLQRLSRKGHLLGIVSNNSILKWVAASLGLTSYIPPERMLVQQTSSETRPQLIHRWLFANTACTQELRLFYYDDRADQVAEVNQSIFGDNVVASARHVPDVQRLFNLVE